MAEGMATPPSIAFPRLQTGPLPLAEGLERQPKAERDQLPLWLPVALAAGIALWLVLPNSEAWQTAFVALGGGAVFGLALGNNRGAGRVIAIGGATVALGFVLIWLRGNEVAAPRLTRPVVTSFEARIDATAPMPEGAMRLTLSAGPTSLPSQIRVNVSAKDVPAGIAIGQGVKLRARLMPPPGAALPGAYDFAEIAWFDGLGAIGHELDPIEITSPATHFAPGDWLSDARRRLTAHILASAPGSPGTVAASFVTGNQGAISESDADAMRRSGLAHLLSISGLHVAAVIGATMVLTLRLLALSPRLALNWPLPLIAALAGAIAGIGYTLLSSVF